MYLKKIEAYGFKSFANKTALEFNRGIMGIVGPNGSGKSNVADAVRWVLGEQSAKSLRGSNMQDVIFAGTQNRKPLGYASVALTIDNSDHMLAIDYDEVTVARRVYRSGESEYLLNGSLCRLKDVQEMFYDTGVGKEGYSIIGQGQIDRILSNKPEDRRELFDEAAGIVKLKKRKHITLKKLETEEGNLLRVTDVLNELSRQVEPLRKQSEKAKAYLKLRDDLKRWDMRAFLMETGDYTKKRDAALKNKETADAQLEELRKKAGAEALRYDELTEKIRELDEAFSSGNEELSAGRIRRETIEGQILLLTEQIQSQKQNEESQRARLQVLEEEIAKRGLEADGFRKEMSGISVELGSARMQVESLEQDLVNTQEEIQRLSERQQKLQADRLRLTDERAETRAEWERTEALRKQTEERISSLLTQSGDERKERDSLGSLIEEKRADRKKLNEEEESVKNAIKTAEENVAARRAERAEKERDLAGLRQHFQEIKARRDSLLNIAERYEGYGNSVKRVMEQRDSVKGICGVVADLFHTERKYETAIETALGGRIQNVITEDEDTAKKLIVFLKENRYGRATFLPLTAVKSRGEFPDRKALSEKGVIGTADSLLTSDEKYRDAASNLLGHTVVVDSMDHALALARKTKYRYNLVTLEGELLSPGGAISGGAYKHSSNLLGRRREIDELEKECTAEEARIQKAETAAAALKNKVASLLDERIRLTERLHRIELKQNTIRLDLARFREREENLKVLLGNQDQEEKVLRADLAGYNKSLEAVEKEIGRISEELTSLEESAGKTDSELEHLRELSEQQMQVLSKERSREATLSQKAGFIKENQDRVIAERETLKTELSDITEALEGAGSLYEAKKEKVKELKAETETLDASLAALKSSVDKMSAKKDALTAEQQGIFGKREELNEQISTLDKEAYRLESSAQRLSDQIEKLTEYIWTEYEMTPSQAEAAGMEASDASLTESRRTVSRLRQEIRELGPVNVNAIEEYKDVKERYEFLHAQHEDLVKAAESLKKIIRDLDTGMRKRFRENFTRIQVEFDRVFKDLFGGGQGSLELAESEELLEAGIIINAQPPGKKLQNMMQLSGGEKALTAIALLFAIQNLKPSPFCLLDEIEAALDEPNVDRFADYLNRLKENTQFIVITHRRGTMEIADRLYGITMQERGVSALVSVDLTDPSIVED
ncbi:MAG: chromosome segregation protein SMC [Lachnospiraceae bacterium]|nr:chromosome segregation protein SMC [Lachnospiraceae bacterium]